MSVATIGGGLQFQLNSVLISDTPSFTLSCQTSNVPTVDTVWRRDGIILNSTVEYLITKRIVNGVQFEILHLLTVTGRYGGLYEFSVTDYNKSAIITRELNVQGKKIVLI